jgi:hypothetical protein
LIEKKNTSIAKKEGDDEQVNQKLNSKMDGLQVKLQEQENENERLQKLVRSLQNDNSTSSELNEKINSLEQQLRDSKKKEVELKIKLDDALLSSPAAAPSSNTAFNKLKDEFVKFAKSNNLPNATNNASDLSENDCLKILQAASKQLVTLSKKETTSSSSKPTTVAVGDEELLQRIANLEEELRLALGAAEDIRALKTKALSLVERIRSEKEEKLRVEADVGKLNKKLEMLTDHIEKLMVHLKHEATCKIKALGKVYILRNICILKN